ncbi:MAG: hypothetical protein HY717_17780 [Planctomycetes bacterium]|nr:hypothetical protein [Planctomycetota bacterium]
MNVSLASGGLVLVLPWVLLTGAGCGTTRMYTGDPLPKSDVATIKAGGLFRARVHIIGVDGYFIERSPLGFRDREVEVLPGEHTVRILLESAKSKRVELGSSVTFNALAGHTYRAEADVTIKGTNFLGLGEIQATWFWIEEDKTGTVVAGEQPK